MTLIEQYLLPGNGLVQVVQVAQSMARSGLQLLDAGNLRSHHVRTLLGVSAALVWHTLTRA